MGTGLALGTKRRPRGRVLLAATRAEGGCMRNASRCAIVLALALMLAGILRGSSFVGSFEIDGNLADDSGPGEPIDWSSPPPNVTTFIDKTGSGDDIFSLGSKELDQNSWICETGSAPPKGD